VAFSSKIITVTFQLGTGAFGETGTNTVTVSGLRASVEVVISGGYECHLKLHGLTPSLLNQLSSVSLAAMVLRRNLVSIAAGDAENGMATVFRGMIQEAWVDLTQQPVSVLTVTAFDTGALLAVTPVAPSSFNGAADVATILSGLARQAGLQFENSGVNVKLATPYLSGSLGDQIRAVCEHAHIAYAIDQATLAIWPRGGSRGGLIPLISPATGMQGYPGYTAQGITVTTLFNPSLRFGGDVQVQSGLLQACGQWHIVGLAHALESETPNGHWFSSLQCVQLQGAS
jgi:hypothetical protein